MTSSPAPCRINTDAAGFENELLNEIRNFINDSIYEQITIEEICSKFSISRSSLQTLFKNNLGVARAVYQRSET